MGNHKITDEDIPLIEQLLEELHPKEVAEKFDVVQLDRAKIGLENQSAENQKKKKAKASKKTSRATKPSSYPEEIKPLKPGSNSDESKPRNKPRNLPK